MRAAGALGTASPTPAPSASAAQASESAHDSLDPDAPPFSFKSGDPVPWLAAVVLKTTSKTHPRVKCTGEVVSRHWVLTAGHCQGSALGSKVKVAVITGRLRLSDGKHGQFLFVDRAVRMPTWRVKGIAFYDDVTLLHLMKATTTRPAKFVTPQQESRYKPWMHVVAAGWGALSPSGPTVDLVHAETLEKLPDAICSTEYGSLYDTKKHSCAGWQWPSMTHDTCNGDSGGPLAWHVDHTYRLIAITSWGSTCLTEGVPGVYTRVAPAFDWITKTMATSP
jgi:secreted trypsin-like serine protease